MFSSRLFFQMIWLQPSHLSQRPSVLTCRSSPSGDPFAPDCSLENQAMCTYFYRSKSANAYCAHGIPPLREGVITPLVRSGTRHFLVCSKKIVRRHNRKHSEAV